MKFTLGLTLATVLILPGWYAVVAWTVWDLNHPAPTWREVEDSMNAAVPLFNLPVTTKMIVLLSLAMVGVIVGIKVPRGITRTQRIMRTVVIVAGVLVVAALTFPFM